MRIRTAKDVMDRARARGFEIRVSPGPPPMPMLYYQKGVSPAGATDPLMNALKAFRLEIIEEVLKETK